VTISDQKDYDRMRRQVFVVVSCIPSDMKKSKIVGVSDRFVAVSCISANMQDCKIVDDDERTERASGIFNLTNVIEYVIIISL